MAGKILDTARSFQNCPTTLIIDQNPDLAEYVSTEELALYTILTCLAEMPRKEIKNVLSTTNIINLLDTTEYADIFENFLNGRFEVLQTQMNSIRTKLTQDVFFQDETIFNKIRSRNLQQFVAPYKVIDIKEIAQAFGISLAQAEAELVEQISLGNIKAKIDSHNKILKARQTNSQTEAYRKAIEVGDKFIRDTEDQLLTIQLLKNDIVLKRPHNTAGFAEQFF